MDATGFELRDVGRDAEPGEDGMPAADPALARPDGDVSEPSGWDRYFPPAERATAWWITGLAVAGVLLTLVLGFARGALPFEVHLPREVALQSPDLAPVLWVVLRAGLTAALLWIAVARLRGPRVLIGYELLTGSAALLVWIVTTALQAVSMVALPAVTEAMGNPWQRLLPHESTVAGVLFLGGLVIAAWVLGNGPTTIGRILSGAALDLPGIARRVAVTFAVLPAVVQLAGVPFNFAAGAAFNVMVFRGEGAPSFSASPGLFLLSYAGVPALVVALFLSVYLGVRRFGAARSVWLVFLAPLAASIVVLPLQSLATPVPAGHGMGPALAAFLVNLGFAVVEVLILWAALALATRHSAEANDPVRE